MLRSFLRVIEFACRCKYRPIIDYILSIVIKPCTLSSKSSTPTSPLCLWYMQPAAQWLEALPIGNGHIGAMVYGGFPHETFQLNADTLWAGCPHDYTNDEGLSYLQNIRQLIDQNQWTDAQSMIDSHFLGKPSGQAPYQPVGNLQLDFFGQNLSSIWDYQRQLDLETAIVTTSYSDEFECHYQRNCFANYPDRCVVIHLQSSVSFFFYIYSKIIVINLV